MKLTEKTNMARECAGVTYEDLAEHFECSKQNVHQMLHRRLTMGNFLNVIEFCRFKMMLYAPNNDVAIRITTEDRLADEKD